MTHLDFWPPEGPVYLGGIARRIPLLKVGYGSQLTATAMAGNMAGNIYLNLEQFSLKGQIVH